jgi:hypothetical protein
MEATKGCTILIMKAFASQGHPFMVLAADKAEGGKEGARVEADEDVQIF